MRRDLAHHTTFRQSFHDERNVALLQVAHTAVGELGRARRGALAKVALLDEQNAVATGCRVDGDARAGCATPDDDDVPRVVAIEHTIEHLTASHADSRGLFGPACWGSVTHDERRDYVASDDSQPLARCTASCQRARSARARVAGMRGSKRRSTCQWARMASSEDQ